MENEKIYVLVPVYNVEAYLERCIDSILNQTYQNWELVLVNDGSKDNSGAICDRYAAEHDNITVIHQENGGVSVARNTGIEYALKQGDPENDWINFIDSDDFIHPKYLEYLYYAVSENKLDISSCGFIRTNKSTIEPITDQLNIQLLNPEDFYCRYFAHANIAWGKLYRLQLFRSIRYPVGKIYEDDFTTHKVLFSKTKVAVIHNRMYNWYGNPNSITMGGWKPSYMDSIESLERQLDFFAKNEYHRALKKCSVECYKRTVNTVLLIKKLSPKYDHLLNFAKAKRKQAFSLSLKNAGLGATLYAWLVPMIMSHKRLRRIAKKVYARIRYRQKA